MITRRSFLTGFTRLSAIGAATSSYAFIIEPGLLLRTQHYAISPPGWPIGFKLRIVAIADLHAGEPRVVSALLPAGLSAADLRTVLKINSFWHSYQWSGVVVLD